MRRAYGASDGVAPISRSRQLKPLAMRRADFTSIFMRAMSTPVGQSRLQPLQLTQRSIAAATASERSPSDPSWPDRARRSVLARPRVRCFSSRVTRKDGHMVPASNFRQWPLLLHISAAFAKPPARSPPVPGAVEISVTGSVWTFQADQSSTGSYFSDSYPGLKRNSERSSMREGRTILPGFRMFSGSNRSFTVSNALVSRGPNCQATHSERTSPSPCSPEKAPLYSRTRAEASSAIARIFSAPSRRMSRIGRTCSVPTEAWAYQVPRVPCLPNTSVRRCV